MPTLVRTERVSGDGGVGTYTADFAFQGLLGTLSPVLGVAMAPAFKKLGDDAEQGMRDALERL